MVVLLKRKGQALYKSLSTPHPQNRSLDQPIASLQRKATVYHIWNLDAIAVADTTYQLYYIVRWTQKAISKSANRYWGFMKAGETRIYEIETIIEEVPYWENDTLWWSNRQCWMTAAGVAEDWAYSKQTICPNRQACNMLHPDPLPVELTRIKTCH